MKLWNWFTSVAEQLGKARAATAMARLRRYDEARRIMQG